LAKQSSHEQIARRAYELYLSRGAADGLDVQDWLEAERQLASRQQPAAKALRTSSARRRS
jgi:hypothetical protein